MGTLPKGYSRLEYIESTGTQYIDTEFKPNQDTRVVCKGQFLDISSTVNMFGTRVSTSSGRYELLVSGNYIFSSYNTAAGSSISSTTDILLIDKNKNVTSNNGKVFDTSAYAAFQANYNLLLFAGNRAGKVGGKAKCRIYFFQIYDNGILIRDYVPCMDSNGVAGLWDNVQQIFYGNAGTGAFVAGAIIPEEPEVPPRKITVDLTPPMTGEKTADFNIDYSVTDDIETESFTVVEYIDDEETQSRTATAGETISTFIESTGMDDGLHTFTLIVDETVEVEYTFYVNNSTVTIETTGVSIEMPATVNINEKFLISVIVNEMSFTLAKLKIHAGDIYSGEV